MKKNRPALLFLPQSKMRHYEESVTSVLFTPNNIFFLSLLPDIESYLNYSDYKLRGYNVLSSHIFRNQSWKCVCTSNDWRTSSLMLQNICKSLKLFFKGSFQVGTLDHVFSLCKISYHIWSAFSSSLKADRALKCTEQRSNSRMW